MYVYMLTVVFDARKPTHVIHAILLNNQAPLPYGVRIGFFSFSAKEDRVDCLFVLCAIRIGRHSRTHYVLVDHR